MTTYDVNVWLFVHYRLGSWLSEAAYYIWRRIAPLSAMWKIAEIGNYGRHQ